MDHEQRSFLAMHWRVLERFELRGQTVRQAAEACELTEDTARRVIRGAWEIGITSEMVSDYMRGET